MKFMEDKNECSFFNQDLNQSENIQKIITD